MLTEHQYYEKQYTDRIVLQLIAKTGKNMKQVPMEEFYKHIGDREVSVYSECRRDYPPDFEGYRRINSQTNLFKVRGRLVGKIVTDFTEVDQNGFSPMTFYIAND